MKHILILALLLCAAQTQAQPDYSKLPTLPVWYELNDTDYGQYMRYLPDFDTAQKGFNALYQYKGSTSNPTWYNRYRLDTVNMFDWGGGLLGTGAGPGVQGDFNGDGIRDYFEGGTLSFFQGIENGKPPKLPAVRAYYTTGETSGGYTYVGDYNNDGVQDVITGRTTTPVKTSFLGGLILGGQDLTKLQVIPLPHTYDSTECIIDAYAKGDGTGRMVTIVRDDIQRIGKMVLWKLHFSLSGSEIKIQYERLAELSVPFTPSLSSAGIIGIHRDSKHTIIRFDNTFALENDKFIFVAKPSYRYSRALTHSMADVGKPGFLCIGNIDDPDPNKRPGLLLQGDPRRDTVPFARVQLFYYKNGDNLWSVTEAVSVGDINGDGSGDLAIRYQGVVNFEEVRRFVIYLGIPGAVGVSYDTETLSGMDIHVSNPVRRGAPLRLTMRTQKTARLELYALGGGRITELWRGTTDGETRTVEAALPALAPGMYNLRLTDGRTAVDKALLITE